jgi:hypothetical protein
VGLFLFSDDASYIKLKLVRSVETIQKRLDVTIVPEYYAAILSSVEGRIQVLSQDPAGIEDMKRLHTAFVGTHVSMTTPRFMKVGKDCLPNDVFDSLYRELVL